jgi:hypothetical protein
VSTPSPSASRRRRRLGRRGLFGVAVLASACVIAVPLAWASHQFTDVPNANPFHNEISALAGAGITGGKTCVPPGTPPTFCPDEPVLRQTMAAFLNRGLSRLAQDTVVDAANIPEFLTVNVITEDMGVPGVGGSQGVKVDAWANVDDEATAGCEISAVIVQDVGTPSEIAGVTQFARGSSSGADTDVDFTVRATSAFRTTSGNHDYTLVLGDWNCTTSDTSVNIAEAGIIVSTHPFDQFGGVSSLGGATANRNWRADMVGEDN